jgi:hypothetical protein
VESQDVPLVTFNHKISLAYVAIMTMGIFAYRHKCTVIIAATARGLLTYFTAPKSSSHMNQVETNTKTQEAPKLFSHNHHPSIHTRKAINLRAFILNAQYAARGTRVIINNDDKTITYGFKNLQYWSPSTESYLTLPDKFYVTCDDYDTASTEFYARWSTYCFKRFSTPYVPIEILSTERE